MCGIKVFLGGRGWIFLWGMGESLIIISTSEVEHLQWPYINCPKYLVIQSRTLAPAMPLYEYNLLEQLWWTQLRVCFSRCTCSSTTSGFIGVPRISQKLCRTKQVYTSVGTNAKSRSIGQFKILQRPFNLPKAHSIWFRVDLNIWLNITCSLE